MILKKIKQLIFYKRAEFIFKFNLGLYFDGLFKTLFASSQVIVGAGSAFNLHSNTIRSSNCLIIGFCVNTGLPVEELSCSLASA